MEDTHEVEGPPPVAASVDGGDILKKLARTVVKLFHKEVEILILDVIIKEERVSLKRFEEILKFDLPLLRTSLSALTNDRIITQRHERVTGTGGKVSFTEVYYIQYGKLANVVKYKLDNMRRRLNSMEREKGSSVQSYRCDDCNLSWSDLEVGELFNEITCSFRCTKCRKKVKEDISEVSSSSRLDVANFNKQTGPLYDLLMEAEALYPTL